MIVKKFIKDEKGAALPFVAIILGLFALGFAALVVDLGALYIDKKEMVTAADAAALAGAQVLQDGRELIKSGTKTEEQIKTEAKAAAEDYAKKNGSDTDKINVSVGEKKVTLPSGEEEIRQTVEVTVGKNQPSIFGRFLNDEDTDVKAHAVGTWGYIRKTYVGKFIPIFTFDSDYKLNTDMYLHDKIEGTNGYGFIDIGGGMGDIKEAIAGKSVGGTYIYDSLLDGKPGNGEAVRVSVVNRMLSAQAQPTAEERKNAMIGLIPVIDKEKFLSMSVNDGGNANAWKLPIKYFAYFEITDVIKQGQIVGSEEALNPSNEYKRIGLPAFKYDGSVGSNGKIPTSLLNNQGTGVANTTVLGHYTGETIEAKTLVEAGDQINPNPGGDLPATYSKLIQ